MLRFGGWEKGWGQVRGLREQGGVRAEGGEAHTEKHKNTLTSGRKERKASQGEAELRSTGCRSPRIARGWPAGGGLDPGEAAPPCPRVKCSGPVRARRPGAGSGGSRPGRQGRGQGAAQQPSVHTHCAIPQQQRPAGGPARPHTHTRGPARPSDTGETRDEVGTRVSLVHHVGGAPRRVGVQQAVHGAEPAEERSGAEHKVVVAMWWQGPGGWSLPVG